MKKMIVKYVLDQPQKTFDAQAGKVVHVHEQGGHPTIWVEAELDEDHSFKPTVPRTFTAIPTGAPFESGSAWHVGTVFIDWMVWHVYEGEVQS